MKTDSTKQAQPVKRPIDDRLMQRLAQGEREALRELYDSIRGSVYGFALSIVRNPHDADDVLQETFVRVYTKAGEYVPRGKPLAWIFTITRHLALDKLREQSRTCPLEEVPPMADIHSVADADRRLLLEALMTHLTEEEKQILILHTVRGITYREIAAVLELPLNTVLSKYHRAVKRLKTIVKEEEA